MLTIWIEALIVLAIGCARAPTATTPAPEAAVDPDWSRSHYVTKIYELVVQYPPPTWASLHVTPSHVHREQNGPMFTMEQIPEDEAFPSGWTRNYGIEGMYAKNGRFEAYKAISVNVWTKVCGEKRVALQTIVDEPAHFQVLAVCESSPGGPAAFGWGEGVGAVALMDLEHLSDTFVRVHHIWRGKRFDRADRSSWPVGEPEMREMLQRFADIRISYNPDATSVPHPDRDYDPN
jgi:hypothetical protein